MIPVLGGDNGGVRHPGTGKQLLRGTETGFLRNPEGRPGSFPADVVRLRDGCDPVARPVRVPGIKHSTLAGSDQNQFHG